MLSLFTKRKPAVPGPRDVRAVNRSERSAASYTKRKSPAAKRMSRRNDSEMDSSQFNSDLDDVDDEVLERLVGNATHLSLGRKGSKGMLVRVPSHERFDPIVNCNEGSVSSSSDDEQHSAKRQERQRKNKAEMARETSPSHGGNGSAKSPSKSGSFSSLTGKQNKARAGDTSLQGIEVDTYVEDYQAETPRSRQKRKLARSPSKERVDAVMRSRRASMSN